MTTIQLTGSPRPVFIDDIVWLKGEASYTRVFYANGTFSLITQPLHWFEQHLHFLRVHRSAIVNPRYVRAFAQRRGRGGWVRLSNDVTLAVARDRLHDTAARLAMPTPNSES